MTRRLWNNELHNKFLKIVDELGIDNAEPYEILEKMDVEGFTVENVSSHLQKYRGFFSRMRSQQENQLRIVGPGNQFTSLRPIGSNNSPFANAIFTGVNNNLSVNRNLNGQHYEQINYLPTISTNNSLFANDLLTGENSSSFVNPNHNGQHYEQVTYVPTIPTNNSPFANGILTGENIRSFVNPYLNRQHCLNAMVGALEKHT